MMAGRIYRSGKKKKGIVIISMWFFFSSSAVPLPLEASLCN